MRGSGSQFGIVTKFTVNVHPIGDVWGGYCTYDASQDDQLYAALHQYAGYGSAADPKSAIIFTDLVTTGGITLKLIYYFYDGPAPPTSGPFADFFKIPSIGCAPKKQKYSELVRKNLFISLQYIGLSTAAQIKRRCSCHPQCPCFLPSKSSIPCITKSNTAQTVTVPYIASRPQMYSEIREKWRSIVTPFLTVLPLVNGIQFSVDFQPLPAIIGTHSAAKGGNAMGLTASDPDRIIVIFEGSWSLPTDDAKAYSFAKQITDWLEQQVPLWIAEAGMDPDVYLPYFINDAMSDQQVMQSYQNYDKFKALQKQIDPNGLFSTRAGGFKY